MGKHCVHSLLASSQGRGKKTQAKVCVKCESESQRERKKIACVILKKTPLRAISFGCNGCLSSGETHRASLGSTCHIFKLKRKLPLGKFFLPPKKENKRKLRVLISEEPVLGFE